jgi:hypothetical protein
MGIYQSGSAEDSGLEMMSQWQNMPKYFQSLEKHYKFSKQLARN